MISRRSGARIGLLVGCVVAVGCAEQRSSMTEPTGDDRRPTFAASVAGDEIQLQAQDRKDTPWQKMDDAALENEVQRARGRVLIGLKDPTRTEGVDNLGRVVATANGVSRDKDELKNLGLRFDYEFKQTPVVIATIPPGLVAQLRRNTYVDYFEPSIPGRWHAQVVPWGVTRIKAPLAWPQTTGNGIKLLILDTGVMLTHLDLNVQVAWRCSKPGPVADSLGHGTHVAGIAAALNNFDHVIGASYGVTLMSASVTFPEIAWLPDPAEVACSLELARINGVHVANMSFATDPSTAITDQIVAGYNQNGMLFVASAGNDYSGPVAYPARLSQVIAVTATDSNNVKANFANVGSQLDLAAPGVAVLSTALPSGHPMFCGGLGSFISTCSGTSMAAPHVAAAAALLKARYPSWSNVAIGSRLRETATDLGTPGFDNTYGNGLLNVRAALDVSATIQGPDFIMTGLTGNWSVVVGGGQPPFTYQWYANATPIGTGASVSYQAGSSDFWLVVYVTDSYGQVGTTSRLIRVCPWGQFFC